MTENFSTFALWDDEDPEVTGRRAEFSRRHMEKINVYEQISRNKINSAVLFTVFFLLMAVLGYILGHISGYGIGMVFGALIIAVIQGFIGYYHSDNIILGISNARPLEKREYPFVYHIVEALSLGQGLPAPKIYVIDDTAPNAFAAGRDPEHGVVAVTTGLLSKLTRYEIEGVVAHEISHIRNYDIRLAGLAAILAGAVALLSDFFLRSFRFRRRGRDETGGIVAIIGIALAILAPLAGLLIQMAISRKREYLADSSAAYLTKNPEGLASALEKIARDADPLEVANKATAHLYIINPLTEHKGMVKNLFSTHPPVEERIKILRGM
ncbi:MAG: M48 family metalloprotease [Bacillota bacterium]